MPGRSARAMVLASLLLMETPVARSRTEPLEHRRGGSPPYPPDGRETGPGAAGSPRLVGPSAGPGPAPRGPPGGGGPGPAGGRGALGGSGGPGGGGGRARGRPRAYPAPGGAGRRAAGRATGSWPRHGPVSRAATVANKGTSAGAEVVPRAPDAGWRDMAAARA